MDLKQFQEKTITHFAENLVKGDRLKATIRHKTDGSKNLINVDVIFLESNISSRTIKAAYKDSVYEIPFNDLSI